MNSETYWDGGSDAPEDYIEPAAIRTLEFDKIKELLGQKCVSSIGRQYAAGLAPSVFEAQIRRDLRQTSDAEQFMIRNGSPPLGNIYDIIGVLKRAELDAILNPAELLQVAAVLRAVRGMKRYGRERTPPARTDKAGGSPSRTDNVDDSAGRTESAGDSSGLAEPDSILSLIDSLVENQRLENSINSCIISEEEIADDASPALLAVRRAIKRLQDAIKDKLNAILRSPVYQKYMQDSLVTMRHDRYVIPVKQEHRADIKGLVHDMSASGATVFVEPMAVVEANNDIREQKVKEAVEIEKILAALTAEVAAMGAALTNDVKTLGLLDFLFAKGKLSLDYDCVAPEIGADRNIFLKRARHPLISRDAVVPIDFWMSEGVNAVVITGPNTGGKTVALKTLGLLTLMAQAGLHIPADYGSSIRCFTKVFADIGDEQSIEQSLSTFSSHMRNIVRIVNGADDKTLALFDEIGAGTDPAEGAAIATAILECLHQTGACSVATTHYSELKLYALTTPGVENACCEFDVDTLRPTYRLLIGLPGKSNAFAISARLGLPSEILGRAREFLTDESVKFEDVLHVIGKNREASEQDRRAAGQARIEAERLRDELERQRALLDRQKESVLREAREEARRVLNDSRRDADEILEKLRRLEDEDDAELRKKGAQALRQKLRSKLDGAEASLSFTLPPREGHVAPPKNLKAGDTVSIVNLNQRGVVLGGPDQNGNVLIRAGIMSITAHVSNIAVVDEQRDASRNAVSAMRAAGGAEPGLKTINTRAEIDVRGARLEAALAQVDRYLEDASSAGLNEATIIHGKGTGALRSGIQDLLRSHPKAKAFRNGAYGEGDMGVTIVTIR